MDEPLTALDAHGRQAVEAMLEAHAAAGGIAIVSTHQALDLPPGMLHQFQLGTATR
jgi:heme exporter protein A